MGQGQIVARQMKQVCICVCYVGLVSKFALEVALSSSYASHLYIWVEIFCLGNRHFLCHFLSIFMVTLSQNEPSEDQKKYPVDKYTKESNSLTLFLLKVCSI